ncbi:MAG: 5-formyltetrahydrofolate cyclo-ligase [Burkholderiales bacterium]|jgi:5-formyltetrahydrofolate cyclo-ligase|nr:5-formyltetrahydrofolate cyclo-ligase [Burkholderiales bacterium]
MKQAIRDQIKNQLKAYTAKTKKEAAQKLLIHLKPLLDRATRIAVYHAYGSELHLSDVINYCLANEKQLYQPLSYKHAKHMLLTKYNASYPHIFSDKEFVPKDCYEWYNLDLILLPLIAVDVRGFRLGKGGGYYDTTLADIHKNPVPILCGIGFDSQLIAHVPNDDWDVQLDYFASEEQLIKF